MVTQVSIFNSEAGFKALFKHATVGIIVVNNQGNMILANQFAENMLGYEREELVGKNISILIPKKIHEKHRQHVISYFKNPIPRPMGLGNELNAEKKDGTGIYVEISLCSYLFEGEKLAVAFLTDTTLRKQENEKIKKYKEDLEREVDERTKSLNDSMERERKLSEIKSAFVSLASHEFRTPLTTILSSSSLISEYNKKNHSENIEKHANRIIQSVENLTHVLNSFLSLDKLDREQVQVERQKFNISDLIQEICDSLESYLKKGQIIIHNHSGEKIVNIDRKLTTNILINLLSNASKYSGENMTIKLDTSLQDGLLEMSVSDTGIGIPRTDQDKLFTVFYRASNAVKIDGNGLGLNIVARYLKLMGGEISFVSEEKIGTTFQINLPSVMSD
jgi:PAS domain S-box-containing protein